MAANTFHVPARAWRKWPDLARGVFNRTFTSIRDAYTVPLAPGAGQMTKRGWRVLAWNAAWLAADAARDTLDAYAARAGVRWEPGDSQEGP